MNQKVKVEIIEPHEHGFGRRIETGVIEVEYVNDKEDPIDWPMVAIRGDDALMRYAPALEYILTKVALDDNMLDVMQLIACEGLVNLLKECQVKPKVGEDDD